MSELRILHNPRCSKSRQTLALLQEQGHQPQIIEYLKTPPNVEQLGALVKMLGLASARDLMRRSEVEYKEQQLSDPELSEQQLLQAMHQYPKLIERPIVINGDQARIGRPPEQVLELF